MSQNMKIHPCWKYCDFRKNANNDSQKIRRKNLLATLKVKYSEMLTSIT